MLTLTLALAGQAVAAEHTMGIRVRRGTVPNGILDLFFFDSDDDGALAYDRPNVNMNVFGLEYTLSAKTTGVALQVWAERIGVPLAAGYWDDKESPEDHIDGDWLAPDGLGLWALGANYANEVGVTPDTGPVWLGIVWGAGVGFGIRTGEVTFWHHGSHPDVVDGECFPTQVAPERFVSCPADGLLNLPGLVPIIDLTIGPKLHLTEHAMVRLDLGLHNALYAGIAAGGSF